MVLELHFENTGHLAIVAVLLLLLVLFVFSNNYSLPIMFAIGDAEF
jgi:hypothetical protein